MGHQFYKDLEKCLNNKACDNWKCSLSDDVGLLEFSVILKHGLSCCNPVDVDSSKYLTKCMQAQESL